MSSTKRKKTETAMEASPDILKGKGGQKGGTQLLGDAKIREQERIRNITQKNIFEGKRWKGATGTGARRKERGCSRE